MIDRGPPAVQARLLRGVVEGMTTPLPERFRPGGVRLRNERCRAARPACGGGSAKELALRFDAFELAAEMLVE